MPRPLEPLWKIESNSGNAKRERQPSIKLKP
jgi:hypothetical protein